MISDLDLFDLAHAAYGPATIESATCHVLLTDRDDLTVAAFRGTDAARMVDILQDVDAAIIHDPILGTLNARFFADVASVAWRLLPRLGARDVAVTGHSKGGAEALIFGAMLAAIGRPPVRLTTFGAARAGKDAFLPLVAALAGTDYRNGDDPVPAEPFYFVPPRPVVQIGAHGFKINPIEDHSLSAYRLALSSRIVP